MQINRIGSVKIPQATQVLIPASEDRLAAPKVAQVYFKTREDRENFLVFAWALKDVQCTRMFLMDTGLTVSTSGNVMHVFRCMYGWEQANSIAHYQ